MAANVLLGVVSLAFFAGTGGAALWSNRGRLMPRIRPYDEGVRAGVGCRLIPPQDGCDPRPQPTDSGSAR